MTALPTPVLANLTVDTAAYTGSANFLGMSRNRQYLLWQAVSPNVRRLQVSSVDAPGAKSNGPTVGSTPLTLQAFIETLDGELLLEIANVAGAAEVWKTTGWNWANPSAATITKVLTMSGINVNARREWGFNYKAAAPVWSVAAGSILLMEYGNKTSEQIAAGRPASTAATHAWLSRDNGATWTVVFDAQNYYPGDVPLHGHGGMFVPADNAWCVWGGDGGIGSESWMFWCPDEEIENVSDPTRWERVPGAVSASGARQVVSGIATARGMFFGSDSLPARIASVARLGFRRFGDMVTTTPVHPTALIASDIHQNGDSPDAPIFATFPVGSNSANPFVLASLDGGLTWQLAHRDAAALSSGNGITNVCGPDVNGKVYGNYNASGTTGLAIWDYQPPVLAP